jgi:hypothetical protein
MKHIKKLVLIELEVPETDEDFEQPSKEMRVLDVDPDVLGNITDLENYSKTVVREGGTYMLGDETFWRVYEDDTQCVSVVHGLF